MLGQGCCDANIEGGDLQSFRRSLLSTCTQSPNPDGQGGDTEDEPVRCASLDLQDCTKEAHFLGNSYSIITLVSLREEILIPIIELDSHRTSPTAV